MTEASVNFMVVGAQKAGTSSLHDLLQRENFISLPERKETHFFSDADRAERGWGWYLAQFSSEERLIRGEVDPDYLTSPRAAELIRDKVGDIPIAVVIRNPLDRAYSQYLMSRRRGIEDRDFESAIADELARRCEGKEVGEHVNYLERSLYAPAIRPFVDLFSQVSVIKFDELFRGSPENRNQSYRDLVEFLTGRLPEHGIDLDLQSNRASVARSPVLARAIWNKGDSRMVKGVLRTLVPSRDTRFKIARLVDRWNQVPITRPRRSDESRSIPSAARDAMIADLDALATEHAIDTSAWRDGLTLDTD